MCRFAPWYLKKKKRNKEKYKLNEGGRGRWMERDGKKDITKIR
jgi:hypothetical protein